VVIVLFWAVMVGWLYQRDLWPRLRSDEPALFQFDLSDEARIEMTDRVPRAALGKPFRDVEQRENKARPVRWKVKRNGKDVRDYVETRVVYQKKDHTLVQIGDYKQFPEDEEKEGVGRDPVLQIESTFHVNWGGELLDISADIWVRTPPGLERIKVAQLDSTIRDNRLVPQWEIENPRGSLAQEPVPLSNRGNALCLTHPFNRITGLVVGQRWQVPVLYLLSVGETRQPGSWIQTQAEVGEESLPRPYRRQPTQCHVITCTREEKAVVRIWVRQSDHLVLRQEVSLPGENLLFERDH
jgi:hypothetical protein